MQTKEEEEELTSHGGGHVDVNEHLAKGDVHHVWCRGSGTTHHVDSFLHPPPPILTFVFPCFVSPF